MPPPAPTMAVTIDEKKAASVMIKTGRKELSNSITSPVVLPCLPVPHRQSSAANFIDTASQANYPRQKRQPGHQGARAEERIIDRDYFRSDPERGHGR